MQSGITRSVIMQTVIMQNVVALLKSAQRKFSLYAEIS
jgi:hypothetical protein